MGKAEILKPVLLGAALGTFLGWPRIAALLAIYGLWLGLVVVAPLLALPSLVLVLRRQAALPAFAFSGGALLSFLIVLSLVGGVSDWDFAAVLCAAWIAFCIATLFSPALLLLNRRHAA